MTLILKDPQARVDHAFLWDDYADGQIIVASQWSIAPDASPGDPAPLTLAATAFDLVTTSVTLGGGRIGAVYRVTNHVTLSDGQVEDRSLTVRIEER